jgi:hypothetical protein
MHFTPDYLRIMRRARSWDEACDSGVPGLNRIRYEGLNLVMSGDRSAHLAALNPLRSGRSCTFTFSPGVTEVTPAANAASLISRVCVLMWTRGTGLTVIKHRHC